MSQKPLKKVVKSLVEWEEINRSAKNFLLGRYDQEKGFLVFMQSDYELRSLEHNAYYHGVVLPCIGNFLLETQGKMPSIERIHKDIKKAFFKISTFCDDGKISTKQSTIVNRGEFYEGMLRIYAFYEPLGCIIPRPNEIISVNKEILLF